MKSSRSQNNAQSKQGQSHKPRPEIRDDLDSRKEKEGFKSTSSADVSKKGKKNK
jgi:hypothetical protein